MDSKKIVPPGSSMLQRLGLYLRLVVDLFFDRRVPFPVKMLPVLALVYVLFPDFFLGPFDDLVITGICLYLFIELSPEWIRTKHKQDLMNKLLTNYQVDTQYEHIQDEVRSHYEKKEY